MPATAVAPFSTPPAAAAFPRKRAWTTDDLHRLREWRDVWFHGNVLTLIDGEILEMPPPGPAHNTAVGLADYWCKAAFPAGFVVRVQMGLPFGINTDPVPDIAVVAGGLRTFATRQPTTAALVIEVSDSTLAHDTTDKASLYAAAGIPDYWVIDIPNRRMHVFRQPAPAAAARYGHEYTSRVIYLPTDVIAPLAAPAERLTVAAVLP